MIQRARQLREEREKHRQELVAQKYTQQFQDACPQLHEVQSALRVKDCASTQLQQVRDREVRKEELREVDREFAAVWEQDRLAKEARHQADVARGKALEKDQLKVRDLQLVELARRREQAKQIVAEERALMIEQWQLDEEKAAQKALELKQYKEKAARQFARFNRERLIEKKREIELARAEDMKIVDAILQRGALLDKAEAEKRAAHIADLREYRAQLAKQMEKEKISEAHLDALRLEEQEKAWEKRQAEWDKEEQMRAKLRAEVFAARAYQIQHRLDAKRKEKAELAEYRAQLINEQAKIEEAERLEKEGLQRQKEQIREYLEWQMEERERERQMQLEDEEFERAHARRTEMAFQEKINQTIAGVQSYPTYYGKQKMGMYY